MKKNQVLSVAMALAASLAITSCEQSDGLQNTAPAPIQFNAGIGEQTVSTPGTRATGATWNAQDAIGIFMVANGTETISDNATNKKFMLEAATAKFKPVLGDEIYYPMTNAAVDFIAYYPYQADAELDSTLPVNTTDQNVQPTFDFLWAKADNNGPGFKKDDTGDAAIPLTFVHRLAKLTMNCKVETNTGITSLDAMVATINGMNTTVTFTPKDGSLGTPATPANFAPRKAATAQTGYLATLDAIILPGNYAADELTVDFTVNGETYTWDVGAMEFQSGNDYVYEVILTRTGVTATGTITKWETVTQGPVYAD